MPPMAPSSKKKRPSSSSSTSSKSGASGGSAMSDEAKATTKLHHPDEAEATNAGIRAAAAVPELHRMFSNMADGLQLLGANQFRVNAYERVARLLSDEAFDPVAVVADARENEADPIKRLAEIEGVGKGTAEKIVEFIDTGRMEEHDELMSKIPQGLFDVLQIPGLGPKTVRAMWEELKITSIQRLKKAIHDESILTIPRMGKKTVQNITQALEFMEQSGGRIQLGVAHPIAEIIVKRIEGVRGVKQAQYAGSLRRGRDTIGDIDVLVTTKDADAVRDAFVEMPEVTQVLAKGETKSSVRFNFEGVTGQADLRIVPEDSWGAALMYFTGSKEHNVRLREIAIRKDMRLNEYGLFKGKDERPQDRGEKPLVGDSEEKIYEALDLPFIQPEL
ncbi:MAG: helix-hairpin-helix domain-containing protein, partial [Planctomycetota bacterium]